MNAPVPPSENPEPIDVKTTPISDQYTSVEVQSIAPDPEGDTAENVRVEEFTINGDALVGKVKELIHQGNIRRIIIKNEEGRILLEIPLTVGVVGGVVATTLFPVVAALGVIGALVAHLTIVIERKE